MPTTYLVAIFWLICGCAAAAIPPTKDKIVDFRSSEMTMSIVFYPGARSAGWMVRDHADNGIGIEDCSNGDWFCVSEGFYAFLAPRKCVADGAPNWTVGSITARRLKAVGQLTYFETTYTHPSEDVRSAPNWGSGFVYSREGGIVGMWVGDDTKSTKLDDDHVLWLSPDNSAFMKCEA